MKPRNQQTTVGIDLGDRKHSVCVLDHKGEILREETITNTRESLKALSKRQPGALMVMEVGMHIDTCTAPKQSIKHRGDECEWNEAQLHERSAAKPGG